MSLRDAVEEIVKAIDESAEQYDASTDYTGDSVIGELRMFSRLLRLALKAAEGEQPAPPQLRPAVDEVEIARRRARLAEQKEVDKAFDLADRVQAGGSAALLFEGGPMDGVQQFGDAGMPVGAKVGLGGGVYVHQGGGRLVYSEEETEKVVRGAPAGQSKIIVPG